MRGRPRKERDFEYYVERELEAISRYAQYRLRGIKYQIEFDTKEKEATMCVRVPLDQGLEK